MSLLFHFDSFVFQKGNLLSDNESVIIRAI